MTDKYYQKYKESFKKKHVKDTKIFLENKKVKGEKKARKICQNFTEDVSIITNVNRRCLSIIIVIIICYLLLFII